MEFNIKFNLSSKELLYKYGEEHIYNFYSTNKETINFNGANLCEFHNERTPSMRFYRKGGSLLFKCFGCGATGDVFKYVQLKKDIYTFGEVIESINEDLTGKPINKTSSFKDIIPSKVDIITIKRKWEFYDYLYWKDYYITLEDCVKYNIEPVIEVFIRKSGELKRVFINTKNNPVYCININNNKKIYRPLATKEGKWLQNCNRLDILGYDLLPSVGELLIISSSMKDIIVLNKLGYSAIAAISETTLVPDNIIENLKKRFKKIIVFLDNDNAGKLFSKTYQEIYNFKTIFTNSEEKDISDFIKKYGFEESLDLMKLLTQDEKK